MKQIEIISMVTREVNRKGYTMAYLSRKLNLSSTSTLTMLRRNTMQVQRLAELSEVLQYNFFKEIGASLPYDEPKETVENTDENPVIILNDRIKELEMEVRILRQTLKDITSR